MSLQDELLKSGLVSKEKAKKSAADQKKQDHQRKKGAVNPAAEAQLQEQEALREQIAVEEAEKRARDTALNHSRVTEKRRLEQQERVRQLIESHRRNDSAATVPYYVQDGQKARRLHVTTQQQRLLAMGQLGIVRGDRSAEDLAIVDRATAVKLERLAPERIILLYSESNILDEEEDWGWS